MAYLDQLQADELKDLKRRIRKLETATPLSNASITEGRLRVGGSAVLLVDSSGGVSIQGTLAGGGTFTWTGALNSDGTTRLTGTVTITGPTDASGNFTARGTTRFEGDTTQVGAHHVQGNQDITGTLAVKGVTTLENNLTVQNGGKITVAGTPSMELGSTAYGAGAQFSNGGIVAAEGTGVSVYAAGAGGFMKVGGTAASLTLAAKGVTITATATFVAGQTRIDTAETVTGVTANAYIGTDGRVRRIV